MYFKPMLASKLDPDVDLSNLHYPLLISPKLDGIRASVQNGVLMSRNLKPIPNRYLQSILGDPALNGVDGELILGSAADKDVFRRTASAVMSEDGQPEVKLYVFDKYGDQPFVKRIVAAEELVERFSKKAPLLTVAHQLMADSETIELYERCCLDEGYEGAMLRSTIGPYKQGRASLREGYLLKLKRFCDGEALVIGMEEKMHNANEAVRELTGRLKRSSHKANMEPMGTMGALVVTDIKTGVQFNIGTGFDDAERAEIWGDKPKFIGRVCRYKYFPTGSKDRPRHPVFGGWRPAGA